jgi:glyoxylase-like metal-dependent hydrolase (beta-lactamase superfamily II)
MAKAMLERIREVSDQPVRYVISTDTRPHRVLGNEVFRDAGAQVVMTPQAAAFTQAQGGAMARTAEEILGLPAESIRSPGAPDVSLTQAVSLDLGGVTLNVIPVDTAHTPGQLIVEVVEDDVVFAGDVLYRGRLLSVLSESRVDAWIDAYEMLRELDEALFVPGHGEPGSLEDFEQPTYEYLTLLKSHMDDAVDEGVGLQDAIESLDQSGWQGLADFDALAGRNAHRTYLEREAAAFE